MTWILLKKVTHTHTHTHVRTHLYIQWTGMLLSTTHTKWQVVDGNLFQNTNTPSSFTHISPVTTQKSMREKNIQCTSTHSGGAMNKKIIATHLATSTVKPLRQSLSLPSPSPLPPLFLPSLPPSLIRHMVWSMFGSGELLATIMEKQNNNKDLGNWNTAWCLTCIRG